MALLDKVHDSLAELEVMVNKIEDPMEREGLKAFIDCVTPHLMENATASFLGKIAQVFGTDIVNASSVEEALEALKRDFEVEIE